MVFQPIFVYSYHMVIFQVSEREDGQRIEKFVKKALPEAPLGYLYKAFRKKDIKINGHWVNKDAIVHAGDEVRVYVTDQQRADFLKARPATKKPFPYEIVYEDENVLLVNKPAGILVYGDQSETRNTLTQNVLDYLYYKDEFNPEQPSFVPSPAHRLDRNTSGLVIFGKRDGALRELERLFKERDQLEKKYYALVIGHLEGNGTIDAPLKKDSKTGMVRVCPAKDGGKNAKTIWKAVGHYGDFTLLECKLVTGRTHQIRVHLASINHPIAGDPKYGDFEVNRLLKERFNLKEQFLHASSLSFGAVLPPLTYLKGKYFEASLPFSKKRLLESLRA